MKRQFLVAQLAMLLEKRTAQYQLPAGLLARSPYAVPTQIPHPQLYKFAMLVQPLRHHLQLATYLLSSEEI